jgi:two-component system, OmpR family, response regulator
MKNGERSTVLVVDDEPSIVDAVTIALRDAHFETMTARDGLSALREIRSGVVNLVVLDVMLPGLSGFDVASILRDEGNRTPILFLTARSAIKDKLQGLRSGDDYLTKPFIVSELVARAEAILRRVTPTQSRKALRCGDIELDPESHTAARAANSLQLTATEFRLLEYLMSNADRVVSKQQILDEVWGFAFDGQHGVVETYVRYLRRKLEAHGPPTIDTVRLVGYVLRAQPVTRNVTMVTP